MEMVVVGPNIRVRIPKQSEMEIEFWWQTFLGLLTALLALYTESLSLSTSMIVYRY